MTTYLYTWVWNALQTLTMTVGYLGTHFNHYMLLRMSVILFNLPLSPSILFSGKDYICSCYSMHVQTQMWPPEQASKHLHNRPDTIAIDGVIFHCLCSHHYLLSRANHHTCSRSLISTPAAHLLHSPQYIFHSSTLTSSSVPCHERDSSFDLLNFLCHFFFFFFCSKYTETQLNWKSLSWVTTLADACQ